MSDNISLSCTNSLVTTMVVINHRNIPRGPRCLQSHMPGARSASLPLPAERVHARRELAPARLAPAPSCRASAPARSRHAPALMPRARSGGAPASSTTRLHSSGCACRRAPAPVAASAGYRLLPPPPPARTLRDLIWGWKRRSQRTDKVPVLLSERSS